GDYVVYDLIEDSKGQVWIATGRHGLWLFDGSDWRETTLELGLTDLLPVVLLESSDGGIWIGSLGQGLTLHDEEGATRWRRTDGIVSDTIGQIIEDQSGYLWLGSDRGLQRISIAGLDDYRRGSRGHPVTSLRFSRADGLPTPQFTAEHGNLTTQTPSGKLWFAQPSGAIRVDPSKISDSESSPYVRVES